jgi:hypothetical protein
MSGSLETGVRIAATGKKIIGFRKAKTEGEIFPLFVSQSPNS